MDKYDKKFDREGRLLLQQPPDDAKIRDGRLSLIMSVANDLAGSFWALTTLSKMSFSVIMPKGLLSSVTMTEPTFSLLYFQQNPREADHK